VTCGTGVQTRERECNDPSPSGGGDDCEGSSEDSETCREGDCGENPEHLSLERESQGVFDYSIYGNEIISPCRIQKHLSFLPKYIRWNIWKVEKEI